MVRLLQKSAIFRVSTGLEAIRIEAIQNDAGNAFEGLRESNLLEVVQLKAQVLATTARALEARVARGEDVAAATAQLKRVKLDQSKVGNELYFATTKYLSLHHVPFQAIMIDGRPMIQLQDAGTLIDVTQMDEATLQVLLQRIK
ncbi:MAG: hypothetical protein HY074_17425 [Deltaproteobacteria bacterium]|nr:hypothetical protein [Deltaproteobacteria bacterium]